MNIALLLSGAAREFKTSYDSLSKKILEPLNPDIFISTWDWKKDIEHEKENGTKFEGTIQEYFDIYKPILAETELFDDKANQAIGFLNLKEKYPTMNGRVAAQWYKWLKVYQLMLYYSILNNKHYDVVIRTRADLVFFNSIPEEELKDVAERKNDNILYIRKDILNPVNQPEGFVHDPLCFGSMEGVKNACYGIFNLSKCLELAELKTNEMLLAKNLELRNVFVKESAIRYKLVRESHEYDKKENKIIVR